VKSEADLREEICDPRYPKSMGAQGPAS